MIRSWDRGQEPIGYTGATWNDLSTGLTGWSSALTPGTTVDPFTGRITDVYGRSTFGNGVMGPGGVGYTFGSGALPKVPANGLPGITGPVTPAGTGASTMSWWKDLFSPGAIGGDLVKGGLGLYGQQKTIDANSEAARIAAEAQQKAAQLIADAQERALKAELEQQEKTLQFQKDNAALAALNADRVNLGNYTQYAARQSNLGTLNDMLHMPARQVAPYVPLYTSLPGGSNGGTTTSGASSAAMPGVAADKGDIGQQVAAYFKSRGVSDAETPYWVSKWAEFGAKDPAYFNQRLSQADVFGGGGYGGGGNTASSSPTVRMASTPGTQWWGGSPIVNYQRTPTGNLSMPGTLWSFVNG